MLGDLQSGGLDATGAHPADLGRSNQTAFFEQLEVLHNGGEGNVQGLSKVLRRLRRATELLHDGTSSWISKRMKHPVYLRLVKHRLEYLHLERYSQAYA
jgi:hypothetical protein